MTTPDQQHATQDAAGSILFIDAMGDAEGAAAARELFEQAYGEAPAGVWAAPGRVNLIGEHTDYNAGLCLPIALPHRTYIALKPREDTSVRVVSDVSPDKVAQADLDGLTAGGVDGWAAYPVGVAWALREAGFGQVKGFDAAFASCVPLGSGLSSSAAMTCSTALALDDVYGLGFGSSDAGRITLINAAIAAENDMAGASTGGLDQNASMRCTPGHALLLDCRPGLSALESVSQQAFDLDKYGLELLVVDTRAPHQLNDGQYAQRRATCEQAAAGLGVENLRVIADQVNAADDPEAALADVLGKLDDDVVRRRVRHVITEIGRVGQFVDAFAAGDIKRAGKLFNASHDSLRDDYQVTVPELDVAVDTARANGAYGARMTGGGFGGSIIALVDKGRSREVAQKIADAFAVHGFHHPRALAAVASASAHRVD
ncbi:galactokinase [Bifidobacterium thermacidophilum subsp. thermacidophilum]|uniref:Galactokinase n=2 Tax=Bifidobacterium thermacidophilum TaxID=246618 RepID=A0A087E3H3_9BIFI|nr:galactokinase [Bifidobacterium thermacidophilum]KFJ02324.1 galactokinase [Bifidobacterium thermacidophilum subsp. thermacidophilum]